MSFCLSKTDCFITVNVSVKQIQHSNFYKHIDTLIKKHDIPPNHLEFELTESVLMNDNDLSIQLFNKLRLLGIKISIDNFGTGFSSFSCLIKLPIDKIKIDQSFIKNLVTKKSCRAIVKTIIKMTKELGINAVAEGVETQEQYDFLAKNGCDYI